MKTTNPHIEGALALVERERQRTEAERAAIERFVDRLSRIEVNPERAADGGNGRSTRLLTHEAPADRAKERIEAAYRDTVMDTDHYEEDYGNAFGDDVAEEFGAEIAHALTGERRLEPAHYRAIRRAARQSERERDTLLRALESESESLARIDDRLSDVERRAFGADDGPIAERSFGDLIDERDRLADLESICERLSELRQNEIHSRPVPGVSGVGDVSLVAFLYGERAIALPALADVVAVLERLRERRRRCERALLKRR